MECNKEEATRAKDIAEQKMQNNDFVGAQKFVIKALQMFPHLENVSQMLTVCDVHCAASIKINGLMNWYSILQVEPAADDSSIKKQYRKLALLLHPDKNQFPGAEAAFKLIGEAQMILSDSGKRQCYDMKCKVNRKTGPTKQPPKKTRTNGQVQSNANEEKSKGLNQQQQRPTVNASQTFWTKCPACSVRFEYYQIFLYKAFYCPNCSKPFIAFDVNEKCVPTVESNPWSKAEKTQTQVPTQQGCGTNNVKSANQNNSRKSSDCNNNDGNNFANHPNKKFKGEKNKHFGTQVEGREIGYPDAEFFDFNKSRGVDKFAVNQIWAAYYDADGMPRLYAQISKIDVPDLKVHFIWLVGNPSNKVETDAPFVNLPPACGNFVEEGESECTEDLLLFSHVVSWQKGKGVNSYDIYPRQGEVWALFKDWNIKQTSHDDNNKLYEYEVVQILSESAETGFMVVSLVKIEGFISLFMHAKKDPYVILPSEILRFSHYIPHYRLNGCERKGVPDGSLELDCAALPCDFMGRFPSVCLHKQAEQRNSTTGATKNQDLHSSNQENLNAGNSSQIKGTDYSNFSTAFANQTPKVGLQSKFYDFEIPKRITRFEYGQIWSIRGSDEYPRQYGFVKKVETEQLQVQITWLVICPNKEQEQWFNAGMPFSCGTFKVDDMTARTSTLNVHAFSQHMIVDLAYGNQFTILPIAGEIWAVYKNWKVGWSPSDLKACDYYIVEISERTVSGIKARPLQKVDGYTAIFKPESEGKFVITMEIPAEEYIRFSHRIPAFHLRLQGFWELDATATPYLVQKN